MNFVERFLRCDLGVLPYNSIISNDGMIQYYNWWDANDSEAIWFTSFLRKHSLLNKRINFFSVFGSPYYIKRKVAKERESINIFFTGENVSATGVSRRFRRYEDHMLDVVDFSLGFSYRAEENYLRFPLWIMYLFKPDASFEDINKKIKEINTSKVDFSRRNIDCAVIARHDSNGIRGRICDSLSEYFDIKYEGSWRNNSRLLKEEYGDNKFKYLSHTKFNICPENADEPGYVTEKIFGAFGAKTIPIYWGAGACPEEKILNQNAFLYWNDSPQFYKELEMLYKNEKEYLDFISQPIFKEGADEIIWGHFDSLKNHIENLMD